MEAIIFALIAMVCVVLITVAVLVINDYINERKADKSLEQEYKKFGEDVDTPDFIHREWQKLYGSRIDAYLHKTSAYNPLQEGAFKPGENHGAYGHKTLESYPPSTGAVGYGLPNTGDVVIGVVLCYKKDAHKYGDNIIIILRDSIDEEE